jgi:hypothetical protein
MDWAGPQKFLRRVDKPRLNPATSGTHQHGARIEKGALTLASQPRLLVHPSMECLNKSSPPAKAGVDFAGASSDNRVRRARLPTAIHVHGARRILTFNERGFPCCSRVEAWHPEHVREDFINRTYKNPPVLAVMEASPSSRHGRVDH